MALQKIKSMQTKPRGKKKNGKFEKVKFPTKKYTNNITNPDLSSLRKPIDTSVSGLYQVSKLLENGTDEVKSILSYECDIIYECRICHSLFRSIVNLISHKREYCRDNFNITLCRGVLDDLSLISATESAIHMCKTGETIIKDNVKNDRILRSQVPKVANKRDLSKIVEMLNKKQEEDMESNSLNESKIESTISGVSNNQHIYLEPIDTNRSAVYQTVKPPGTIVDTTDLMKEQLAELQDMMDHDTVTLEGHTYESQLEKSDSPIQADMSDEENELLIDRLSMNNLICNICNAKFSTKKTLTFHMKTLHTAQRMCYPCPCCTNTFANTWSVHRHLIKVHRKTNEQVRKLRSHIQEKAFYRETNLIEDLEKPHAAKTSTMEKVMMKNGDEADEWRNIYHSESDGESQTCIRCEKRFDRKAALSAHLQYCQESNAVCNKITNTIAKRNNQHESNNKTSSDSVLSNKLCEVEEGNTVMNTVIEPSANKNMSNINSGHTLLSPEIIDEHHKNSIHVQTVSSLTKEDWDMLGNHHYLTEHNTLDNNNFDIIAPPILRNIDNSESVSFNENQDHSESNKKSQSSEIICTNVNGTNSTALKIRSKKRKMSSYHKKKRLANLKKRDITEVQEDSSRLKQPSRSIGPSETKQTLLMEDKIATIANLRKLQCLLCKQKFTSTINLRRHMAIHIGWYQYRCKLCDFKCFVKCDCVAHCNKMHNTQNNRATIEEMVVEIPQNEYMYNEDIIVDVTNVEDKMDNLDIVDITPSSCQPEIHENLSNSSDMSSCVTLINKTTIISEQDTDSCRDKRVNIDAENNDETMQMQNLTEYIMNRGPGKLDAHPDLKRMVMEVILGSNDTGTKPTDSDKLALNTSDDAEVDIDANDNKTTTAPTHKSKRESCSLSGSSKHQRPTRNRIKPLNEDFVYDLKKVLYRKDCALFKEPPFQLNKSSLHLYDSETVDERKKAKVCN